MYFSIDPIRRIIEKGCSYSSYCALLLGDFRGRRYFAQARGRVAPIHDLEHTEQGTENQHRKRQHHTHSASIVLLDRLVLLPSQPVRHGLLARASGMELAIAIAGLGLVDST